MSLRNLSADFAFYGLLDLLQRSVSLIMVPLYTRMLSQPEYGKLDLVVVVSSILVVIVDLQFVAGVSRFYLERRGGGEGRRFIGTVLVVRLVTGLGIASTVFAAGMMGFVEWDFVPSFQQNRMAWLLLLLMVPVTLAYDVLLLQARMLRWRRPFAVGAMASVVVSAVLSVVFVVVLHWGIAGVVLGLLTGKSVGMGGLLWELWGEITWTIDRGILRPLLLYALPLVPGWWMSFGAAYIGRFFIYGLQGADANAILAVTMKVTSAIGMFAVSFRSAWLPLAMSYIGDAEGERFYIRSMRLFMAGGIGSTLILAGLLHPLLAVLTPGEYGAVELYFPLFAVGALLSECESNLQLGNQIAKTTHWISAGAMVYLVVNVSILATMTGRYGILAVGLGLMLASLARASVTYATGQRNWHIPYDGRSMAWFGVGLVALLALGAALAGHAISPWLVRGCILLVGIGLPWLVLDHDERRGIGMLLMRLRPGNGATPVV